MVGADNASSSILGWWMLILDWERSGLRYIFSTYYIILIVNTGRGYQQEVVCFKTGITYLSLKPQAESAYSHRKLKVWAKLHAQNHEVKTLVSSEIPLHSCSESHVPWIESRLCPGCAAQGCTSSASLFGDRRVRGGKKTLVTKRYLKTVSRSCKQIATHSIFGNTRVRLNNTNVWIWIKFMQHTESTCIHGVRIS